MAPQRRLKNATDDALNCVEINMPIDFHPNGIRPYRYFLLFRSINGAGMLISVGFGDWNDYHDGVTDF